MSMPVANQLSVLSLAWYDRHRRDLPWRVPPGVRSDPYRVWLSEIMLQQTTVAAVDGYFRRFVDLWPTVEALAGASLDDVLREWAGLGYYARARNLHKCAQAVAGELAGQFPQTEADLIKLPGIGPYTAAAIAAIAFDRPAAAVDGNVERVLSRHFAIEVPLPDSKPQIRALAAQLVPADRPGDFAQSLMDLGATICTPRSPDCPKCPWHKTCLAHQQGIAGVLPRKRAKADRPTRYGVAFWIENAAGEVLLRRRPETGLLGGMMEFPSTEWSIDLPEAPRHQAPVDADWHPTGTTIEHTFTHFHLTLDIWRTTLGEHDHMPHSSDIKWACPQDFCGHALPSVMKKIAAEMAQAAMIKS